MLNWLPLVFSGGSGRETAETLTWEKWIVPFRDPVKGHHSVVLGIFITVALLAGFALVR